MSSTLKLYAESVLPVPPPPSRYTLNEWYLNNRVRNRTCLDQQQLADKILAECEREREHITEITLMNKREVDHKLEEKIGDISFNKGELIRQRKEVCLEIDNLSIYNERIVDALAFLKNQALLINKKCILFREERLGIDLCHDDVERELHKETEVIESAMNLLCRIMEQGNEQLRRLRSTTYFIDRDLEDKDNVLQVDGGSLSINQNSMNLSMYHGFTPLDPANITVEEADAFTKQNIARGANEINSARCLRSYVNTMISQVMDDLRGQANLVNESFRRRIDETKEAKVKLEGFMALAHTRLGRRAQRPGIELCRDLVELNLVNEVRELRDNCATLQQLLAEAQASLRYLLKTQIQIEEDINVKTNSLKIDEVDCMTLRQGLDYHNY
ncbi:hypothetical protein RI129_006387 [Pyrocoelia pectoralis]|uniref:Tektin n=1 Tax=Pyrocoelia pectoralis TaxID=417401 RepID=A0AAN7VCD0_9COLE